MNATQTRSLKDRRFKLAHVVILNGVAYLDGLAADLAVLDESLALHGCVQDHRNPLPAVRAGEEILHQISVVSTEALVLQYSSL